MTLEHAILAAIAVPVLMGYTTVPEAALVLLAGACATWATHWLANALSR